MAEPHETKLDVRMMRLALAEAAGSARSGEVPIGAVVVLDGEPVGLGRNMPIGLNDPTGHAEILALRAAGKRLRNYRMPGSTLYCTLEPCIMCLGAAVHARVSRVVYGAADPKVGATALLDRLQGDPGGLNHRFQVTGGVLEEEAGGQLREFFLDRRAAAAGPVDNEAD